MTKSFPGVMQEARALIQGGRLADATTAIREALGGQPSASPVLDPFAGPTIELRAEHGTRRGEPSDRHDRAPASDFASVPGDGAGWAARWSRRLGGGVDDLLPASLAHGLARRGPQDAPLPAGARFETHDHRGPAGRRRYRLYVPATRSAGPAPLIVMLHGCTQDPGDFAAGTGMNALAETVGALVAYPEQPSSANPQRCWNWFDPAHQRAGTGEPAILAGIAREIAANVPVDETRIFAAGLSAGGAMAAVLGATYPDVFAAIGVHSGLPHGAASDVASALGVMRSGKGQGARRVSDRPSLRLIVFHGRADRTVHPANGDRLAEEAREAGARPSVKHGSVNGRSYERTVVARPGEAPRLEHWAIQGLGHAWSGGNAAGTYADPAGPDASAEMLRFFLRPAD